jgi:uncharacterized protein
MTVPSTRAGTELRPVASAERIELLDVLRGFALGGIFVSNIQVLSGITFQGPAGWSDLDRWAVFLVHILIDEKFYSIFSLLFGIGFAVIMTRSAERGAAFAPLFRRRLAILLGIGLAHALLVWPGDILVLYAVLGFLLLPFRDRSPRTILAWSAALLVSPVAVYLGYLAIGMRDLSAPPATSGGDSILQLILGAFRAGDYLDVLQANLVMYVGRWMRYFVYLRVPKVLGMFLLGVWLVRSGIVGRVSAHRALLRRTAIAGLVMGIPVNVAMAWLLVRDVFLPASPLGLLQIATAAVGVPLLALGYAATIALLLERPGPRRAFLALAPAGRMALTTYLAQSVAGVVLFYGIGLGLFQRIAPLPVYGIALAIFALQLVASRAWMARFAYGPIEWLWRRLTYRRPLPLGRARSSAS